MGKLTAAQRRAIPPKDFALPGRIHKGPSGKTITKGAEPIQNRKQARTALTVGMRGQSPANKAKIRHAVAEKYPGLGRKSGARRGKSLGDEF